MIYSEIHTQENQNEWIVFVHGAGGNISTWNRQIGFFKAHFNLLTIDLRGHGKSSSDDNAPAYTFEQIAQDILEVLVKELQQ